MHERGGAAGAAPAELHARAGAGCGATRGALRPAAQWRGGGVAESCDTGGVQPARATFRPLSRRGRRGLPTRTRHALQMAPSRDAAHFVFARTLQTHTAQNWADTFISELNDTHIEADLRLRHAPPPVSPDRPARTQGASPDCCLLLSWLRPWAQHRRHYVGGLHGAPLPSPVALLLRASPSAPATAAGHPGGGAGVPQQHAAPHRARVRAGVQATCRLLSLHPPTTSAAAAAAAPTQSRFPPLPTHAPRVDVLCALPALRVLRWSRYNATLTTHVEASHGRGGAASKRHHELLKHMAKPNPKVLACIQELGQVRIRTQPVPLRDPSQRPLVRVCFVPEAAGHEAERTQSSGSRFGRGPLLQSVPTAQNT